MKEGSEEKFNFFIPANFEKAKSKKGEEIMRVKGIASTDDTDSEGEVLLPIGFELERFLNYGNINWNHQGKSDPGKIIGEPDVARITPKGELYIEGTLYKGHPLAQAVWAYADTLEKNDSKRKLGWSIEGRALSRDPQNAKRITKALITGVAITPTPVNCSTYLDLVKGIQKGDYIEQVFNEEDVLIEKSESNYLYEFSNNGKKFGITKSFEVETIDTVEKGGKSFPIGTLHNGFKKVGEGDWRKVSEHGLTKQEHEVKKKFHLANTTNSKSVRVPSRAVEVHYNEAAKHKVAASKLDDNKYTDEEIDKCMDVAATQPLVPESLDKKPKLLEPIIKKAILSGLIPIERIVDIQKSMGEGSRGGKIIGHTKSGKPIYENYNHPDHNNFSSQDHKDASDTHMTSDKSSLTMTRRDEASAHHYRQHEALVSRPYKNMAKEDLHKLADKKAGMDRMAAIKELAHRYTEKTGKVATMSALDRKELRTY